MASKQCDNRYDPPMLIFYYEVSNIPLVLGGTIGTLIIVGIILGLSWNILKNQSLKKVEMYVSKCPMCGNELPKVQKELKFCPKCRANLELIKDHEDLPIIATEDLVTNKEPKLWKTKFSIGLPLGASLVVNLLVVGLSVIIMFILSNLNVLSQLPLISVMVSVISIFSIIFVIFPVLHVRKYLEEPTFKNSLILLGFTSRGFDKKGIAKESLIGIVFAIIGFLLVLFLQNTLNQFIEFAFNIEIEKEVGDPTVASLPTDIPSLIFAIMTILLFVATTEEIAFRGFMQKGLVRSLGNKRGIIITAFIFSMIHLIGVLIITAEKPFIFLLSFITPFLPLFCISLMLGLICYWRNENLIAVVITHGFYNVFTIIYAVILLGLI
jgi:membrane protease YdiL (CAAX protease family)